MAINEPSKHAYSAKQALDLLKQSLQQAVPALYERIQLALDAGKEVLVEEAISKKVRGRKGEQREYRKNLPFSDAEALRVVIDVLEAHLVESRLFASSAVREFQAVLLAVSEPPNAAPKSQSIDARTGSIAVEIESEPETVQSKEQKPNTSLAAVASVDVGPLQSAIHELRRLITF